MFDKPELFFDDASKNKKFHEQNAVFFSKFMIISVVFLLALSIVVLVIANSTAKSPDAPEKTDALHGLDIEAFDVDANGTIYVLGTKSEVHLPENRVAIDVPTIFCYAPKGDFLREYPLYGEKSSDITFYITNGQIVVMTMFEYMNQTRTYYSLENGEITFSESVSGCLPSHTRETTVNGTVYKKVTKYEVCRIEVNGEIVYKECANHVFAKYALYLIFACVVYLFSAVVYIKWFKP